MPRSKWSLKTATPKLQANFTTLRNCGIVGASENEKFFTSLSQDLYRVHLCSSELVRDKTFGEVCRNGTLCLHPLKYFLCTVRLLTHVLCKTTHFFFHSFIATMSNSPQISFNSVIKDWADKYHVRGIPTRAPSRSNSR